MSQWFHNPFPDPSHGGRGVETPEVPALLLSTRGGLTSTGLTLLPILYMGNLTRHHPRRKRRRACQEPKIEILLFHIWVPRSYSTQVTELLKIILFFVLFLFDRREGGTRFLHLNRVVPMVRTHLPSTTRTRREQTLRHVDPNGEDGGRYARGSVWVQTPSGPEILRFDWSTVFWQGNT